MSAKKRRSSGKTSSRNRLYISLCAAFLFAVIILTLGELGVFPGASLPSWSELYGGASARQPSGSDAPPAVGADTQAAIHILDTGQSDCILIITNDKTVLIDAGDRGMGSDIMAYLDAQGVQKLDLLVATHPHADHIGSMAYVVKHTEVSELLMPELPEDMVPTTRSYEDLIDAALDEGCKVTAAAPGQSYELAQGCELRVLGPAGSYDNMNNWSVATRLVVGKRAFLFMGDAEKEAEQDILATGAELKCDVLKAGHHGSNTSSSSAFLDAAAPKYAVIPCGVGNDYGHPHKEILSRFAEYGLEIFRTDLDGAVVFTTDGIALDVSTEK